MGDSAGTREARAQGVGGVVSGRWEGGSIREVEAEQAAG